MDVRLCTRSVAFRASDDADGDGRTLRGYAAVFNQPTRIDSWEGRFDEVIDRRAFNKTLRERKPIMQWNHGFDPAVGQIPIGVYERLTPDDHGLDVEGPLADDPVAERVRIAIKTGAVTGMSFKFRVLRDEWRDGKGKLIKDPQTLYKLIYSSQEPEDGVPTRTIKEIALYEAGPVSTPAYSQTTVGVRSRDDLPESERQEVISLYARNMEIEDDEIRSDSAQVTQSEPVEDESRSETDDDEVGEDGLRKSDSEKPYGDVPYADPGYQKDGKKRYPIDTKEHVKAAWSYINQKANAAKYTPDQVAKIKAKIKTAAKKLGVEISDDSKKSDDTDTSETRSAASTGTLPGSETPTDAAPAGTSVRDDNTTNESREGKAMNLEALRARRDEIVKRATELDTEYRDAVMPDEQDVEFEGLKRELEEVEGKIASIVARQEYAKSLATRAGHIDKTAPPASRPGQRTETPAFHEKRDIFDIDATRMESSSPEEFRDALREDALRFIETARFSRVVSREKAQERAAELIDTYDDEDGTLAKRMLLTGSPLYERAWGKALRACTLDGLSDTERRAMQLGADEQGGFAVPVQLDPTVILTNDGHIGDLRQLARVETIVGKEWQGITSEGINVSRDGSPANAIDASQTPGEIGRQSELDEAADGSFYLEQPTVRVVRVQGFVPFSIEIEQDWGGLRSEITRMLADAKGREENESFVLGDGTGTPPQPGGVIGSLPAGSKVTPTTAETFAAADIYKVKNALAPRWRGNAQWLANIDIYDRIRQFDTAGGGNFWTNLNQSTPEKLVGYSINENSYMDGTWDAAVTAANNLVLLFGDFQQFLIVDRIGMNVELVPHVMGANGRPTGQRGVYAIWRNNAKVLVPEAFRVLNIATTA